MLAWIPPDVPQVLKTDRLTSDPSRPCQVGWVERILAGPDADVLVTQDHAEFAKVNSAVERHYCTGIVGHEGIVGPFSRDS